MSNSDLVELDKKYIWHPCSQMKDYEKIPLIPISRGDGIYLYDFDGNRFVDCVSSWWVNLFGHNNPYINSKLKEQIDRLEHVIFGGFTHEGIVRFADRLISILPDGLDKCFFADNGSSAIEVALKMSFHSHILKRDSAIKTERNKFLSLSNSYHGETLEIGRAHV